MSLVISINKGISSMRKLVLSVLTVVVSSTFLVACGGSSDSSDGTNNGTEPFAFEKYSQCEIENNQVSVPIYQGCKTTHPSLNKGQIFALECQVAGFDLSSGSGSVTRGDIKETYKLKVIGSKSANIRSVVNDINKNGVNSVYKYYCVK